MLPLELYGRSRAYPLSFSALGLTGTIGRVIDGSEAGGFYTASDMKTLATTNAVDSVGGVTDLSGNDRHLLQTLTANRPVYVVTNGIQGYRSGFISGVRRHLEGSLPRNGAHTYYAVYRRDGGASSNGPVHLRQASPLFAVYHDATDNINVYDNGVVAISADSNNIGIVKVSRAEVPGVWSVETFTIGGASLSTAISSGTGTTTNADQNVIHGGSDADDREAFNTYFEFECDSAVTAGQHATIMEHITTRFGGLT